MVSVPRKMSPFYVADDRLSKEVAFHILFHIGKMFRKPTYEIPIEIYTFVMPVKSHFQEET
jgi:hypothetical protein